MARHYRQCSPPRATGSWVVAQTAAVEAFDSAALFDRAKLARLYGGRHPRIARGPIGRYRTDHVVLLLSPYPEADFSRLNPGTLIMTVRISDDGPGLR